MAQRRPSQINQRPHASPEIDSRHAAELVGAVEEALLAKLAEVLRRDGRGHEQRRLLRARRDDDELLHAIRRGRSRCGLGVSERADRERGSDEQQLGQE